MQTVISFRPMSGKLNSGKKAFSSRSQVVLKVNLETNHLDLAYEKRTDLKEESNWQEDSNSVVEKGIYRMKKTSKE